MTKRLYEIITEKWGKDVKCIINGEFLDVTTNEIFASKNKWMKACFDITEGEYNDFEKDLQNMR